MLILKKLIMAMCTGLESITINHLAWEYLLPGFFFARKKRTQDKETHITRTTSPMKPIRYIYAVLACLLLIGFVQSGFAQQQDFPEVSPDNALEHYVHLEDGAFAWS